MTAGSDIPPVTRESSFQPCPLINEDHEAPPRSQISAILRDGIRRWTLGFLFKSLLSYATVLRSKTNCGWNQGLKSPIQKRESKEHLKPTYIMNFVEHFLRTVSHYSDSIAVRSTDQCFSYRQLHDSATMLGASLAEQGVKAGESILYSGPNNPRFISLVLAAWSLEANILPVDPRVPQARKEHYFGAAKPSWVISDDTEFSRFVLSRGGHTLTLPNFEQNNEKLRPLTPPVDSSTAYMIFTSGSTGAPKIVEIDHAALGNTLRGLQHLLRFEPCDTFVSSSSISFDVFWLEMLLPLACGGAVLQAKIFPVFDVSAFPASHSPGRTFFQATPSVWRSILNEDSFFRRGSVAISGGEALDRTLARRLVSHFDEVWNLYGPTESTIWSTGARLHSGDNEVTAGKPIGGNIVYILDAHLSPVPPGEVGEIYIGGSSLAKGYFQQEDLTTRAFLQSPFRPGERIYRTGDLGRWSREEELLILGRADRQCKVFGVRIELDEVEEAIRTFSSIHDCSVLPCLDETGTVRLHAWVMMRVGVEWSERALREYLSSRLLKESIPSYFVNTVSLPTLPSGKVDREELRRTALQARSSGEKSPTAANLTISWLREYWERILGYSAIEPDMDLFANGASSLHLAQLQLDVLQKFGRKIAISELVGASSIGMLAQLLVSPPDLVTAPPARQTQEKDEKIAVIGMDCSFAGARGPWQFWNRIIAPTSIFTETGDGLRDFEFDHDFFGISRRDALLIDPQQRQLLLGCWRALEHAGYNPKQVTEKAGLFVGTGSTDYLYEVATTRQRALESYSSRDIMVASQKDFASSRISFLLNLRGPSISIQAACATGLAVIHQAAQSLHAGECDLAIAGASFVATDFGRQKQIEGGICSPRGECLPFDARASGTVFRSGTGVVVLRRLSQALKDGDTVHAVVLGSAIGNHGSEGANFMSPSARGQARVMCAALEDAQITPESVSFIETHGTGTLVGDPIEAEGLAMTYDAVESTHSPCYLGAVKSILGHTDATAGMAGFIKTTLALQHQTIPPTHYLNKLNPAVDFRSSAFAFARQPLPWQGKKGFRHASVSAFGLGGVNAHVVLREHSQVKPPSVDTWRLITLSAHHQRDLLAILDEFQLVLDGSLPLRDIAYTSNISRSSLRLRSFILTASLDETRNLCRQLAKGLATDAPSSQIAGEDSGMFGWFNLDDGMSLSIPRSISEIFKAPLLRWFNFQEPRFEDLYSGESVFRVPLPAYPFSGPVLSLFAETAGGEQAFSREDLLIRLWRETLGVNTYERSDNFFSAGGDSLCAIGFLERFNRTFGAKLNIQSFFGNPTLGFLMSYLHRETNSNSEETHTC